MRLNRFLFALAMLCPVAAHAALPCSAYPNTLTNGTLADANQVMANFNNILNCVNSLSPLGIPVVGSSSNIKANNASAGLTVTVTADSITVGTALNGTSYTLTSYSQAFNGGTTGAGGMDTGTLPTSGWLGLYAIYNPTAPAISILGTNCTTSCPTVYAGGFLPAGYTASALLATVPTNATPAISASVYVRGKKIFTSAGTALSTATGHASVTSVSITSFVPPNAISFFGQLNNICGTTPGNAGVSLSLWSDSGGANSAYQEIANCVSVSGAAFSGPFPDQALSTAQTLYYTNAVAGTSPTSSIFVQGYSIP